MPVKLSEVAKLAGVSIAAASYALNGRARQYGISKGTEARIKQIAEEQGYVANRTAAYLKKGRYHLITLIAPHFLEFFANLLEGIEHEAEESDYHVLFCSSFNRLDREKKYLKSLIARRVDGVIIMPTDVNAKHLLYLSKNSVPSVLFRHRLDSTLPHKFMSFDDVQGARLATRHLLDRGCRKVAFCSLAGYTAYEYIRPIHETRIEGFRRALEEAGLAYDEEMNVVYAGGGTQADIALVDRVKKQGIDGIVGISDEVVVPMMRMLRLAGIRIPEDLKLVGFGDSFAARISEPPLSTLSAPRWEMGVGMVQALMRMIESGEHETDEVLYPFGLIARQSTGG
jgi:LacI family transcriptional regulator